MLLDRDVVLMSRECCRIFGLPVRDEYPSSLTEGLVLREDETVRSNVGSRSDGSAKRAVEYRIRRQSDGALRWISRRAEFVHDDDGRVVRMIGMIQDVTDQRLLNHEISHRLKNTLTLVQSIARHSLRGVADRGPVMEFDRRLMALSTAHDVLLDRLRPEAPVRAVVDAVIEGMSAKDRTSTDGPDLELNSQSALMLAMLIHELVTNSMKYGALTAPGGMNHVRWSLDGDRFALEWEERGGPPTEPPTRKGFGSRLIERGLGGAGEVTTRYDEQGFNARLTIPFAVIS